MTGKKINEIMEGCAFLECCGNLYEYIGHSKDGKLIFQNVSDDSYVKMTYDQLRKDECYRIQY